MRLGDGMTSKLECGDDLHSAGSVVNVKFHGRRPSHEGHQGGGVGATLIIRAVGLAAHDVRCRGGISVLDGRVVGVVTEIGVEDADHGRGLCRGDADEG